jgi:hypothetical protein
LTVSFRPEWPHLLSDKKVNHSPSLSVKGSLNILNDVRQGDVVNAKPNSKTFEGKSWPHFPVNKGAGRYASTEKILDKLK